MGSFLLLYLRRLWIVPFIPSVAGGRSFCYTSRDIVFGSIDAGSSHSACFWFDQRWLGAVSVVLFQSALDCRSQCVFVLVVNGSL